MCVCIHIYIYIYIYKYRVFNIGDRASKNSVDRVNSVWSLLISPLQSSKFESISTFLYTYFIHYIYIYIYLVE